MVTLRFFMLYDTNYGDFGCQAMWPAISDYLHQVSAADV